MHVVPNVYSTLATSVLFVHAFFIVWVVFGTSFTRSRPILCWLHIASLIWGLLKELLPWPCPLTLLENWLEQRANVAPYQGGFLLHYMDKLVYPDISATTLPVGGVIVCVFNLAFYGRQAWRIRNQIEAIGASSQPRANASLVARIRTAARLIFLRGTMPLR